VNYLNPTVKGQYDRLQDAPESPSEADLLRLYYESIKTAFQIGMSPAPSFADCPKETLDHFERGLAFATVARGVKD
jgi:hypothetical protein